MRRSVVASVVVLCLTACEGGASPTPTRPVVIGAIYPLVFVIEKIGGDHVDVRSLTTPGGEPHDLELGPRQVTLIKQAALLVYLGGGFQPATEAVARQLGNQALDVLSLPGLEARLRPLPSEEAAHEEDHDEERPTSDPHVWLDPVFMQQIAKAVGERMVRMYSADQSEVRVRTEALVGQLQALDRRLREGVAECTRRELVTSHSAFGYLANRYGLIQMGITVSPESEPSPQHLAEVARFVRERGVTTIFFEKLVSPKIAQSLAREAGVRTAVLDPIEGRPGQGDYIDAMDANLEALRKALGCR